MHKLIFIHARGDFLSDVMERYVSERESLTCRFCSGKFRNVSSLVSNVPGSIWWILQPAGNLLDTKTFMNPSHYTKWAKVCHTLEGLRFFKGWWFCFVFCGRRHLVFASLGSDRTLRPWRKSLRLLCGPKPSGSQP